MDPTHDDGLPARYFDGRSARARPVRLHRDGPSLLIEGDGLALRVPLAAADWPERTRHGPRIVQLPDGASLQVDDRTAFDTFVQQVIGRRDGLVVRLQQSWRAVLASVAALGVLLAVVYVWGLPLAARGVVAMLPAQLDQRLGEAVFSSLDGALLQPSRLDPARQLLVRARFERLLAAQPAAAVPLHRIEFRASRIGPNAFALPGGTIVLTDALVTLAGDDVELLAGVLAHELGHVRRRHGMRLVVQVGVLSAVAGLVLGDFSTLLAGAPVLLGQAAYSRAAEREADADAAQLLRDGGVSPAVMLRLFEALQRPGRAEDDGRALGIAFGSHPPDAERIRFFREAAAR